MTDSPKELFNCDFAGCNLTFVRKDLRDRHKKRHRQQSTIASSGSANAQEALLSPSTSESDEDDSPLDGIATTKSDLISPALKPNIGGPTSVPSGGQAFDRSRPDQRPEISPLNSSMGKLGFPGLERTTSATGADANVQGVHNDSSRPSIRYRHSHGGDAVGAPPIQHGVFSPSAVFESSNTSMLPGLKMPDATSTTGSRTSIGHAQTPGIATPFMQSYFPGLSGSEQAGSRQHRSNTTSAAPGYNPPFGSTDMEMSYDTSVMEDGSLGISPSGRTDEFTSWLFDQNGGASHPSHAYSNMYQPNVFGQIYYDELPPSVLDQFGDMTAESDPLASPSYLLPSKESGISDWKRTQLLAMIQERFSANGNAGHAIKQQILGGNLEDPAHVMSMASLQVYLSSYWTRFHDQFPLLHKATFIPDQIHECLLLSVLVVGASLLDDTQHGSAFCEAAAQLANFIAWSLRWQILTDVDSGPPAKLWVLQSLAILEFYEKMNATRALHERAHVHFAATLTLMRRGSALIGEQSMPPSRDETHLQEDEIETFASDKWWNHWIAQEATRRAAFGAFFLDALHATMFGHAATMVIHEIQLPLPCDDTLWSASTASEVGRIEFSLYTNGIKPTMFLTGIKRTLSCQKVRTNPFGRIILMAGLLSIAWHMHQKELYRSTLEDQNLGMPEGWKSQILKAVDFWKQDFDDSYNHMRKSGIDAGKTGFSQEGGVISQHLATGLYHLGHIAVQIDMPDLCILAGAKVLLGRVITKSDYERVHNKLRKWALTAGARHAVHYSIRYLKLTLFDAELGQSSEAGRRSSNQLWDARFRGHVISPDIVLIRPWVMYFSALVLWAYGYLLDGPLRPFPESIYKPRALDSGMALQTPEQVQEMEHDAKLYLQSMGRFGHPNGLQNVPHGRNRVVGLIGVVLTSLESSRWELLHEARSRLHNCLDQLR
jgi:hypothetical protein